MIMGTKIDQLGFKVNGKRFFPLGFNYWPRNMAVYLFPDYDSKAVERDMQVISELGGNCVRMFIRWEDLNPSPGVINRETLEKFDDFLAQAEKYNVKVVPCILVGHMSGQDWFPDWFRLKDEGITPEMNYQIIAQPPRKKERGKVRDFYRDPLSLENSKLQIKELLTRYKDNDTIISWDLSNENQYWMTPRTLEIGLNYVKEMFELMRQLDPNHALTYGMGKPDEGGSNFISFGTRSFAQYHDYYSVHVYPYWLYPMADLIMDFYVVYRPAFECCLAKMAGMPVQLQEFGMSDYYLVGLDNEVASELIRGYYNVTLWDVILNEIRGGVLTWCFCDFLPALGERNPYDHKRFELFYGVVDKDYSLKSSGEAFKKFVQFVDEVNIFEFSRSPAQIAVILPDRYNEFPGTKALQQLPSTKEDKDLKRATNHNHNKTLFSAFVFLKMGHFNFDFTSLFDLEPNLDQYQAVLLPNLYDLSERTIGKCLEFLEKGQNRLVYFSSNTTVPWNFSEDWQMVRTRKKRIYGAPLTPEIRNFIPEALEFKSIRAQCHLKTLKDGVTPILGEVENQNRPLAYERKYGNNKAVFLAIAPEINHTLVRKSYQNESGNLLYSYLLNSVGLRSEVECNNPLVEVGILYNSIKSEAILIAINHEFSQQKCRIKLMKEWKSIEEFYNSDFTSVQKDTIEFFVEAYGIKCFIVSF